MLYFINLLVYLHFLLAFFLVNFSLGLIILTLHFFSLFIYSVIIFYYYIILSNISNLIVFFHSIYLQSLFWLFLFRSLIFFSFIIYPSPLFYTFTLTFLLNLWSDSLSFPFTIMYWSFLTSMNYSSEVISHFYKCTSIFIVLHLFFRSLQTFSLFFLLLLSSS